jgi:hypothetical protein
MHHLFIAIEHRLTLLAVTLWMGIRSNQHGGR